MQFIGNDKLHLTGYEENGDFIPCSMMVMSKGENSIGFQTNLTKPKYDQNIIKFRFYFTCCPHQCITN